MPYFSLLPENNIQIVLEKKGMILTYFPFIIYIISLPTDSQQQCFFFQISNSPFYSKLSEEMSGN